MHSLLFLIFFFILTAPSLFANPLKVIVSVAPMKYLVEQIGKDQVICKMFVPPGTSPHSYEPSVRQVLDCENASIWFRTGEGFETRVFKILKDKMPVIDLREGLPLLVSRCGCCEWADTHIWMSPQLLKMEAENIAAALTVISPQHALYFSKNLETLQTSLSSLDLEIKELLKDNRRHYFLVSHPAFAYFCRDYHLEELSIEISGKEPTAKQVSTLLKEAQLKKVDLVISEPQYNNRGATIMAHELNANIVSIDPYEENVIENLRAIAKVLSQ
jgi:zinc transport system substrate-binding protein